MVWTCAEEGEGTYWAKCVEDGAARLEEKSKSRESVWNTVKEDIKIVGIPSEEERDRVRWRQMIHCDDPYREQPEKKEVKKLLLRYLAFHLYFLLFNSMILMSRFQIQTQFKKNPKTIRTCSSNKAVLYIFWWNVRGRGDMLYYNLLTVVV